MDEIDGFGVDMKTRISINKLSSKYQIIASRNLALGAFELLAFKQQLKTAKFILKFNEDGNKKFNSNRNLSSYKLVLKLNGEEFSSYSIA